MLQLISEIIISVFFIFGVYCAALELWRLTVRIAVRRRRKKEQQIDNGAKKDYNKCNQPRPESQTQTNQDTM